MTPKKREEIRMMFGGFCAYCGIELNGKWHIDHVQPVKRDWEYVKDEHGHYVTNENGYTKTRATGKLWAPHNEREDNLYPACVKCNILKSDNSVEGFRHSLAYFAKSIPKIRTYSHVHHLMRFGKLTIDPTPVVFWFEKYEESKNVATD